MDSEEAPINLEDETYEVLDFEDDNISTLNSRAKSKTMEVEDNVTGTANRKPTADDEGELKSDEDSGLDEDNSSEEGEVQSEIDEMEEPAATQSPAKNETPWERGLRLAREKLEKVRALKASEKDLAEKRLTLPVAAPEVPPDSTRTTRDDVFWLYYYKASIVGRTELTCRRFLPEDLQPPSASELAEWRLGISGDYHGHRRRRYRRGSSESVSSSSSSSSSSRASSSRDSASEASSLFSVAASWKATCARAMKDYLSSPIRNKDRRMDRLRSSSLSSGSASDSGSSDSGSDRSNRPEAYRTGNQAHASKTAATREGRPWDGRKARSRSAGSRSSSGGGGSSTGKPGYDSWKYGSRKGGDDQADWQDAAERSGSHSPVGRHRSDVPPLPHERPVKRPWVAAPGLVSGSLVKDPSKGPRANSSDHSRGSSRSASPAGADEKRFITSWSRSPSSGDNEPPARRPLRRERLPDVVPGTQPSPRVRRPITPALRQRLPDSLVTDPRAMVARPGPATTLLPNSFSEFSNAHSVVAVTKPSESVVPQSSIHERTTTAAAAAAPRQPVLDHPVAPVAPPTPSQPSASTAAGGGGGGGELPSNRPGVRMTLAPRLKASGVDMANIPGGVTRPSGGRTAQQSSPPRLPRLPFPLPSTGARAHSPVPPGGHSGGTLSQLDIRRQAEAAAAIVEERERRRAAAEAAQRRKNPVKKKRDDLSKIPVRGRPTYRRQSFSDSSGGSGSSASRSGSSARDESVDSRSPSGTPEPNIIMENVYEDPPVAAAKSRKRHKAELSSQSAAYDDSGIVAPYGRQPSHALLPSDLDANIHPFQRKPRHPTKMSSIDDTTKYRSERQSKMLNDFPYKMPSAQTYPKNTYADYEFPQDGGSYHSASSRRRGQSHAITQGHGGMRYPYNEEPIAARYDQTGSRYVDSHRSTGGGQPYMQSEFLAHHHLSESRPAHRAGSPHGDLSFGDAFGVRAPQSTARAHKVDRKRTARDVEFDQYDDPLVVSNRRKRAVVVSPTEPQQTGSTAAELRRARSRHRSRGPGGGAPIDRSEPFESSETSAAEQRLRELRERLNRVDDAIAEIKAGSSGGGYFGMR